jgi:hypothetical protein
MEDKMETRANMKTLAFSAKLVLLAGVAVGALSVFSGDLALAQGSGQGGGSQASGASDGGGGGGGASNGGGGSEQGGSGSQGGQSSAGSSGGSGVQVGRPSAAPSADADDGDDSDRPDWAGGNPEENPHAGAGTGNPSSGTTKGDIYGDIVLLLRDLASGEPVVAGTSVDPETGEEITEYYICLDAACTETVATEMGEIPAGVTAIEVDFGRSSVARAPDRVTDQALDEALAKLEDATEVGLDVAGRITYNIDGVWYTIDSPLENLALYTDLSIGLADEESTSETEAILASYDLATLDMAASLLAGVADKTGDITLDYLVNENVIAGVVEPGDYYEYDTFEYSRTYPTDYTYWVSIDGALPVTATLDINAYLADETINGELPDAEDYAALFAAASDDALEVIELVHTQIHTEILPGTVQ